MLDEALPYRDMAPDDVANELVMLCSAGMRLLAARDDLEALARERDPLPESSRRLLKRLRGEARSRRQGVVDGR
ncbi:MAG: hypothetical protein HY904_01815 [Deltaproteobacteria bacterium]|nr:hypothetical protein [Deltaproteobacteria bacterium]